MRLRRFGRAAGKINGFTKPIALCTRRRRGRRGERRTHNSQTAHMIAALFFSCLHVRLEYGDGYFGEVCDMNAILHCTWDGWERCNLVRVCLAAFNEWFKKFRWLLPPNSWSLNARINFAAPPFCFTLQVVRLRCIRNLRPPLRSYKIKRVREKI